MIILVRTAMIDVSLPVRMEEYVSDEPRMNMGAQKSIVVNIFVNVQQRMMDHFVRQKETMMTRTKRMI